MKKIFLFLLIAASLTACKKDFDEINSNPNDPTEVPATNVLLSAISSGMSRIHGDNMNMTYAGLWSQHYAKIQYIDEDNYAYRPAALDIHWTALYAGPLFDLTDIINRATDETPNMKAAAMVMKAYYLSVVTDMWGMVPYSEALQGADELTPAYDDQASIYAGLLASLETAAGMFDATADDLGLGDVLYNGDVSLWEKLANSLRVRLLMRTSDRDAGAAAAAMAILSGGNVFTSNADNASLTFVGDNSYPNPLYENKYIDGRDDHAVSERLVDLMNAGGLSIVMDPRLPVYAAPNGNNGVFVGQPNGSTQPSDFDEISRIGTAFRDDPTAPVFVMTYAELMFLSAEAGNSKADYLAAIDASITQHGATPDAAFTADADAAYDADADKALGEQKWVALFGNGVEAFSEARRLDYPVLTEVPNSVYPGQGVPMRLPYASTEGLTNGTNQSAAETAQGVGTAGIFAKVWWDVN